MSYSIIGIFAFILILGAAVVLHEFGHFIVAKLLKIRVETFSVGFGPRLFGKRWGQTDYRVSAIPLGGYVKLGGDESNAPLEGEGATDIPPHEMFNLRPRYQRIMVALAGPVMNILTAFSIPLAGALLYGVPTIPAPVITYIVQGGAADTAGLKPGDRIVEFNGTPNPKWETINGDALLSPDQPLPLTVDRSGQRLTLNIKPTPRTENGETAGMLDFTPDYGGYPVMIGSVTPNSPAAAAGLQPGDRVAAIAGQKISTASEVTSVVRARKDQPLQITVQRNGQLKELTTGSERLENGMLGIGIADDFPLHKVGLAGATSYAYRTNVEIMNLDWQSAGSGVFRQAFNFKYAFRPDLESIKPTATQVNRLGWDGFLPNAQHPPA